MFLSGSEDGTVNLYKVSSFFPIKTFSGHRDDVTSVAFSPDGSMVLTGSLDGTAKLWSVSDSIKSAIMNRNAKNIRSRSVSTLHLLPDNHLELFNTSNMDLNNSCLIVYNSLGRKIANFKVKLPSGSVRQEFKLPADLAGGVYFYRIDNSNFLLEAGAFWVVK
jgi:WD40 repeat protein